MSSEFYLRPTSFEALENRIAPATLLVTNASDNDIDGSLRHVINLSNADPSKDTIVFDKALAGTITLTSDLPTITGHLIINGPGVDKLTIDGASTYRIFNLDDGDDAALKKISISGLRLFNGDSGANDGGAILSKEELALKKSIITGNEGADGAAVFVSTTGKLLIQNTTFVDNIATGNGGGLNAKANDIKIIRSVFSGNTATGTGAGIYAYAGKSLLIDTTSIINNTATGNGGGLGIEGSGNVKGLIKNSVLTGNISNASGGGIHATIHLALDKVLISGNTSVDGGGMTANIASSLMIKSSQILGNTATGGGGGLYLNSGSSTLIKGSLISGNSAATNGGGIYSKAIQELNIDKTTQISGNQAGANGGGIRITSGVADISAIISANQAGANGGGISSNGTLLNLNGTKLSSNDAAANGGGVHAFSALNVNNATFHGNTSVLGGGLFAVADANSTIIKSTFSGNVAADTVGGAYMGVIGMDHHLLIKSSKFTSNSALAGFCGGLAVTTDTGTTVSIIGTLISQNKAAGACGGLFLNGSGSAKLSGSFILDNLSATFGGGIFLNGGSLLIEKGTISSNLAGTSGGGIHNATADPIIVNGTKISENFAPTNPNTSGPITIL